MLNLFVNAGENTLPEQVEVNKQNIQLLAAEIEKLGYTPKGEYSAETEYKYNDVVFYDYKLYAMIKEDGVVVGVLPTNAEYWQAVTGSIRGQQGAQGAQGADGQDGAAGADGKSALAYTVIHLGSVPQIGGTMELRKAYFTRDPELNEKCTVFVADSFLNRSYIYITEVRIAAISGETVTVAVQQRYSLQGVQGEAGAPALVYDRKIDFVWNGQSQQLISGALPIANFNRTPNLNEDFVAILHDTVSGVDYLAMGEVQTIVGTNVTSIVANDINRITGADGQNGTNGTNGTDGTDGKDALVYNTTYNYFGSDIVESMTLTGLLASDFNRTPIYHEYCILVCKATTSGRSFIAICRVDNNPDTYVELYVSKVVETTGTAGAGIGTLYTATIYMNTSADRAKLRRIINNSNMIKFIKDLNAEAPVYFATDSSGNAVLIETNIGSSYINTYYFYINVNGTLANSYYSQVKTDGTVTITQITGAEKSFYISYYANSEIS